MMKSVLNHVAILVSNIESVVGKNYFDSELLGDIEEFPSEGTREMYIGSSDQMGKLLLMQPNGKGPYESAYNRRGCGLHHIAIDVLNIDEFVDSLAGSGWMLHPKSLSFYKSIKQVWLTRSGVPTLIEVNEREKLVNDRFFIEELEFPFSEMRLLESLRCRNIKIGENALIRLDSHDILISDLLDQSIGTFSK
jgi:hypothetical protein